MDHGIITAWAKGKITDNRSKSKFIGTEHKADSDGNKPAEGSFAGKTGFKAA